MKNKIILLIGCLFIASYSHADTQADTDNRSYYCKSYARDAVAQNRENKNAACGFSGLRWSDDEQGQYQWCLQVTSPIANKEFRARKSSLEDCYVKQASPNHPNNQIELPNACKVPDRIPIRKIYAFYRYDKLLQTPVQDGHIQYDFNGDQHKDHAFLEHEKERLKNVGDAQSSDAYANYARLVFCLSDGNAGWQRYVTNFRIDAGYNDSFMTEQFTVGLKGDNLNITSNYFEHNAGSSFGSVDYAFDPIEREFKIVDRAYETYPVEYDGMPYPMAAPRTADLSEYK